MVTCRESLAESCKDAVDLDDRTYFKKTSKNDHVESLDKVHLSSSIHGVDSEDLDILSCRRFRNAVTVIDDDSAWLYLRLEFLE